MKRLYKIINVYIFEKTLTMFMYCFFFFVVSPLKKKYRNNRIVNAEQGKTSQYQISIRLVRASHEHITKANFCPANNMSGNRIRDHYTSPSRHGSKFLQHLLRRGATQTDARRRSGVGVRRAERGVIYSREPVDFVDKTLLESEVAL